VLLQEVADRLGISVKTVEKHISRAMRETNCYLKIRYSARGGVMGEVHRLPHPGHTERERATGSPV